MNHQTKKKTSKNKRINFVVVNLHVIFLKAIIKTMGVGGGTCKTSVEGGGKPGDTRDEPSVLMVVWSEVDSKRS